MFNFNSCIVCEDSISDPVCRTCYIKQIGVLLNDLHLHEIATDIILNKIRDKFPISNLKNTKCVLCGREKVTMCRHCFSIILTNILRELNFTEDSIDNFGYNLVYEEFPSKHECILNIETIPEIEFVIK
jgi:hypothetical protein